MKKLVQNKAIELRKQGFTYSEISQQLSNVPKGTLSSWLKEVTLSQKAQNKIKKTTKKQMGKNRTLAIKAIQNKKINLQKELTLKNSKFSKYLIDKNFSKIALALIYACEGSKSGDHLTFGNSDPAIIKLFLKLLREVYSLDENKFRCTLQAREDQNIKQLEIFWSKTTNISPKLFYQARIDKRTIGKISRKKDYKGVCRIDYLSAYLYHDLYSLISIIMGR